MNWRGWLAVLVAAAGSGPAAGQGEPPLPEWQAGDVELLDTGGLVPGLALLGRGMIDPETGVEQEVPAVAVPAPEPGESVDNVDEAEGEVPEEFLAAYFERRPEHQLVDPQQLLSRQEYDDRLGFLRYHSGESLVDVIVYLFDGRQEIPGEVRAEELVERLFSEGRPAAGVLYFLGAPQRSRLLLSPQLTGVVTPAEQRRGLSAAVAKALEKSDAADQLDGFTLQLSIWLYRVERALGAPVADAGPLLVLAEPEPVAAAPDRLPALLALARRWLPWVAAGAGGALLAAAAWWVAGRRARHRLPELAVEPRLGGAHAAGIGAVVSFASTTLPPSAQREQMTDCLLLR